jgi:hypothetical protein
MCIRVFYKDVQARETSGVIVTNTNPLVGELYHIAATAATVFSIVQCDNKVLFTPRNVLHLPVRKK